MGHIIRNVHSVRGLRQSAAQARAMIDSQRATCDVPSPVERESTIICADLYASGASIVPWPVEDEWYFERGGGMTPTRLRQGQYYLVASRYQNRYYVVADFNGVLHSSCRIEEYAALHIEKVRAFIDTLPMQVAA